MSNGIYQAYTVNFSERIKYLAMKRVCDCLEDVLITPSPRINEKMGA